MMRRKLISLISASAIFASAVQTAFAVSSVGDNITVNRNEESAAEPQALIDARPDIQRQMEYLDRGLTAVTVDEYVFLSWRWLGTESADTLYNVYKNGELLNQSPLNATNYTDLNPTSGASYQIAPVIDGTEGEKCDAVSPLDNAYFDIPLQIPAANRVNGEDYTYSAGDASVFDADGDGVYEVILKWDPSNAKDAASTGYTGECIIDCYKLDGTRLWRINMGPNIRSGAHDTQIMAYDFDGDGKGEVALRTADGTIAGDGTVIGDEDKNYAVNSDGKNLTGPLYLTVFNGMDGSVIDTVDYYPQTTGKTAGGVEWDISAWGDTYGNRSERYLGAIGCLDGEHYSFIFARGYYTGPEGKVGGRTAIAAYDLVDGKIQQRWIFDTLDYENNYIGQGNHSMSTADVDYDGCDEIIYGALAIDHDGTPMYSTGLGHGDAQHVGDLDPSRPGLEVYSCHEETQAKYAYEMRDARTGEILYGASESSSDNGRGASDDIDPNYPGCEGWSAQGVLTAADGTVISTDYTMSANFFAWWDSDLGREVQDGIYISKWNHDKNKVETIWTGTGVTSINGTKANPSLTADIMGDWREEVIYPLKDSSALRVFITTEPTSYRIPTLMHDIQYRNHVAIQNVCYNQPTHVSYYLGYDTETVPVPQIYVVEDGEKITNPQLSQKSWSIDALYSGDILEMVPECATAVSNGVPSRIDNDNADVMPYISVEGRTMVPVRFISETFGADVDWNESTKEISIVNGSDTVKMTVGSTDYTINGTSHTMDSSPVITDEGRTFVPLRAIAEALGKNVSWANGLIIISDTEQTVSDEDGAARADQIKSAPVPEMVEPQVIADGEKLYDNQLDVYGVEASGNDGNMEQGAVDLSMDTRWSNYGASTLTVDLGSVKTVTGVAIAMWKGAERIYPFSIEVSEDGVEWVEALAKTQNSGTTENFEKYDFPTPVSARYVRYSGDGATDPDKNYCHISEIAILGE